MACVPDAAVGALLGHGRPRCLLWPSVLALLGFWRLSTCNKLFTSPSKHFVFAFRAFVLHVACSALC